MVLIRRVTIFVCFTLLVASSAISSKVVRGLVPKPANPDCLEPEDPKIAVSNVSGFKDLLLASQQELTGQLGKEKDFVASTRGRYEKAVNMQLEVEAKLSKMLSKAQLCVSSSKPAIKAIEKQLAVFFEAGDRSADIAPMEKFINEAQLFATNNYAPLRANTDSYKAEMKKLAHMFSNKSLPSNVSLSPAEKKAIIEQTRDWKSFMNTSLITESEIVSARAQEIFLTNTRSVYHIWHVLPEFLPAMRSRKRVLPAYIPLHDLSIKLAEHCTHEVLSLNQTLTTVTKRRKAIQDRLSTLQATYAGQGGAPKNVIDLVNALRSSTSDLQNMVTILLDRNPKLVSTRVLRAEAMVMYWKKVLAERDPDGISPDAELPPPSKGAGSTGNLRVDEAADDGGEAAAAANAGVGASAGPAPAPPAVKPLKLVVDKQSVLRAKKWLGYWQKESVAAQMAATATKLKNKMAQEVKDQAVRDGLSQVDAIAVSALAAANATGNLTKEAAEMMAANSTSVAAPPADPTQSRASVTALRNALDSMGTLTGDNAIKTKLPKDPVKANDVEKFNRFLHQWMRKEEAAKPGSNAAKLAGDWVQFWLEKLGDFAQPLPDKPRAAHVFGSEASTRLDKLMAGMRNGDLAAPVGGTTKAGAMYAELAKLGAHSAKANAAAKVIMKAMAAKAKQSDRP